MQALSKQIKTLTLITTLLLITTVAPLYTQQPPNLELGFPELTGLQRRTLLLIARESIDSRLEGRLPREATVEARLTIPQALVASIWVDNKLRARAWRLLNPGPLYLEARDLVLEAINAPKVTLDPITLDELSCAKVSLAVLSDYKQAEDDKEVPPGSAVIIYSGFTEWLALPGDIESNKAADLLSYACQQAGLRPNIWLLPQKTVIYSAKVEGAREGMGF